MGTMCPALATRTKDRGPSRRNVPPAQACGLTLQQSGGRGWQAQWARNQGVGGWA